MKNRLKGVGRRELKYVFKTASTEELAPMLHRWLDIFENAVREEKYEDAALLFHSATTGFWFGNRAINGLELVEQFKKTGWGDLHQFALDSANATIIPCERTFVLTVPWSSKSRILMGRDKKGEATFVLRFFEKKLLCLHVHFS